MAFGQLSTNDTTGNRSIKNRRKIFWQFPQGGATLTGLLSLLPPADPTDKSEFGWYERRFPTQRTETVASGTAPFLAGDGTALADLSPLTENTEYRIRVLTTDQFKATHVIEIRELTKNNTTTTTYSVIGVVTQVISSTVLKFRPLATFGSAGAGVDNGTTDNNGKTVAIIGTANAEGARSGSGIIVFPTNVTNYTQIFRSAFSITRTALKGGLEFDKSGPYKMMAKENGMRHLLEMEKAFLWGYKHTVLVQDPDTGESTPESKTGGVRYFLEQWEAADSPYRGGSGAAAITSNTDDNKRIIDCSGTLTRSLHDRNIERLFSVTIDPGQEKLCLCGSKYLGTINRLYENQCVKTVLLEEPKTKKKFVVFAHETLHGTVYYKSHPQFTNDPDLNDAGLYVDLGALRYRPLTGSDTEFLKGRQETDRDGRKDEWITEAGLECRFPEAHMLVKNATQAG